MRARLLPPGIAGSWLLTVCGALAAADPLAPLPLADSLRISGIDVTLKTPPAHFVVRASLGLITHESLDGQLIHRAQGKDVVLETRATITPGGDYLLMFPEGGHYGGSKGKKVNRLLAYRSADRGRTWQGPVEAFNIDYSQHGFIPLIPRGTKRLYAFGTQPIAGRYDFEHGQQENAPIGFRWSDDDGRTWSDVTLIRPGNDPAFKGMSVMRMCETDSGVWLLGSHASDFSQRPLSTRQYLLRSADHGKTWTVLPGAQPNGWFAAGFGRMDEGRPIALGGRQVFFMARTTQGHLFTAWSDDDGQTWTPPAPSPLVHPDAPPMLFPLSDGRTLVAFHHNRVPQKEDGNLSAKSEGMTVRGEIWVSTSTDGGHAWTEPRFLLANAAVPNLENSWRNYQCSYLDAFTDRGVLHLFMPHRWQQALHLTIAESALATLPTRAQFAAAAHAASPSAPNYVGQLAAKLEPTRRIVYQTAGAQELHLDLFAPADLKAGERRPAFVTIHGGGWTSGNPRSMYPWAAHCAQLGLVGVSVQYRLYQPGTDVTVFECVKDARSAVRYVRAHAAELGIDPQRIVVNGASAGGHLAAATALCDGVDSAGEDLSVSCAPNALVLFSPVIDTSTEGYGNAKVGARWRELSPAHQVRASLPPTITFHGTGDTTTPFKGAQLFHQAMLTAGNRSELVGVEGAPHAYMFKDAALHADTVRRLDAFLATLGYVSLPAAAAATGDDPAYDLVVVEATPGGIAMAVRAAREGLRVLLTNHTAHLGGILSSGLGVWDTQWEGKRAPIYDEVRQAIFDHYRATYGENSAPYREALPGKSGHTNGKFEARVAEQTLTALVAREKNLTVLAGYYPAAAERDGATLRALTLRELGGARTVRATARIFADCTYEGDVLPLARVPYRLGREARGEFGEPHAGAVFMRPAAKPPTAEVAALAAQHERLQLRKFPGFQEVLPASTGAADPNVQAFNYRTMLSSDPANRAPVEKPADYDPAALKQLEWGSIVAPIPNHKLGWNRPQLVGAHTAYVEADWPARQRILDDFWRATMGLLYFMQHDPSVPAERRAQWSHYGLALDEFPDHAHRPYEFYVREARRVNGRYVFTEHDATLAPGLHRAPPHADSIAITEWYMDAHACTLRRAPGSLDEGKMMLHQETFPGQIPFRALLPQGLDNLIVPVCLSATHVAWGTVRLEPTWMNLGEAAGFAAVQARQHNQSPAEVDPDALLRTLARNHVMVSFFNDVDVSRSDPEAAAAQYFGAKGFFPDYDARLDAPLTRAVADAWTAGWAQLQQRGFDPMTVMRTVATAEAQASEAVAPATTRGAALVKLWQNPR